MNNPWSRLPNAHHIDWVLESLRQNPQLWAEAWDATAANEMAREAAWDATWEGAWDEAWDAAWAAAWDAAWDAAKGLAKDAAISSILALIAYDDCDQYLNIPYEKLQVYNILSNRPQSILLFPMIYVREKIMETT